MPMNAAITGWGWHSPEMVLTNRDLEKMVHTTDDWIRRRYRRGDAHCQGLVY